MDFLTKQERRDHNHPGIVMDGIGLEDTAIDLGDDDARISGVVGRDFTGFLSFFHSCPTAALILSICKFLRAS